MDPYGLNMTEYGKGVHVLESVLNVLMAPQIISETTLL